LPELEHKNQYLTEKKKIFAVPIPVAKKTTDRCEEGLRNNCCFCGRHESVSVVSYSIRGISVFGCAYSTKKGVFMKTRFALLLLLVGVVGLFLGGCSCFTQAQKGEIAPPPPQAAVQERVVILASEPKAEEQVVAVAAQPAVKVVVLAFEDIHFDFDKATLKPEAQTILKRNIQLLKENPKAQVRVAGYTSASGTDAYNQKLSERRANAVKGYLVSEGLISPDRLSVIGYGKTDPAMHEAAPKELYSPAAKANMRALFEIVVQ
jgi:outer membrane protein OmpA-like peptidoglycan-associated protein